MNNRRKKGFPLAIIFVIFLVTITVFSWKSCYQEKNVPEGDSTEKESISLSLSSDN
jgi:hypothetical protein